ncbi:ABC transporter substrate-binding protein [Merdimonas faecis]|uniref:ABC transporter substrate-binding protein n=1 Tax=Merdimonas faecis TaxID=1653435 RepID=UPI0023F650B4|nr:ABC transporter substrate-binding protein [Merdimonas faecis]
MRKKRMKRAVSLLLAAVMTAGLLAGCQGEENESDGGKIKTALDVETKLKDTKLEGEIDESKTTITTLLSFTPEPAGHGHPYVEGGPDWSIQPLIYDTLCDYATQPETEFKPVLLENYTWEDKVLTMKLKEGLMYSDGTPINADELINNMYMDLSNLQLLIYAESIEKVDDLTVRVKYTKDSSLIITYLLKSQLMFPSSQYGEWAAVYKDIFENMRELNEEGDYDMTEEGQKLFDETTLDCNNYLPRMTEIKTSGAYYIDTVTSDEITLKENPNYRDDLVIDTIVGIRQSSTEAFQIAVQNGEMDLEAGGLSTDLALQVAESNKDTIRQVAYPAFSQWGFCMNVNKAPTDKLEVRQAIAYLVDTESIAPATEPGMMAADEYATALPYALRDKYLSDEDKSELTSYKYNEEKATELLESVGWTKQGGQWFDETGAVPKIEITGIGAYQVCLIMGEAVANKLQEFGIDASFVSKEVSAYSDYSQSGQAHMVIDGFGSSQTIQHPYEAYSGIWWYGKRMNLTFPTEGKLIWKDDVTGEDFHYEEVLNDLKLANSDEEASKYVKEIATFFNHNVWYIPVTDQSTIYRIHNDKLSLPSVPTGEVVYDFYWSGNSSMVLAKLIHSGEVHYVK